MNVRDRLTVNQALAQPWIREKVYRVEKLSHVQEKFAEKYPKQEQEQEQHPEEQEQQHQSHPPPQLEDI